MDKKPFKEAVFFGIVICLAVAMTSCKTVNVNAMGSRLLMDTVKSGDASTRDAVAAANEIGNRVLTEQDGNAVFDLLVFNRAPDVNVALLKTMQKANLAYLCAKLVDYFPKIEDPDTAVECAATIVKFTSDTDMVLQFVRGIMLENKHAKVRFRSAKFMMEFYKADAEALFIQALQKEKSASTATLMCSALNEIGTQASLPILEEMANDKQRFYDSDHFGEASANAETVRAAAVMASENLKRNKM